jgi:hypothetical protein
MGFENNGSRGRNPSRFWVPQPPEESHVIYGTGHPELLVTDHPLLGVSAWPLFILLTPAHL